MYLRKRLLGYASQICRRHLSAEIGVEVYGVAAFSKKDATVR